MKGKVTSFVCGVLAAVLLLGVSVSAGAWEGKRQLEVEPIDVLIDGKIFAPRDAAGNEVPVFTYNGTTYAPLRALAEAYGLAVGYDAERHLATVSRKSGPASCEADFKAQWDIAEKPVTRNGNEKVFTARYSGGLSASEFKKWWKSFSGEDIRRWSEELAAEAQRLSPACSAKLYFSFGTYNLGTAYAFGGTERSSFTPASEWIR